MSPEDLKALEELLDKALDAHALRCEALFPKDHLENHKWVKEQREREAVMDDRVEAVKRKVIGSSIITLLGLIAWLIGDWAMHFIQTLSKGSH